MKYRFQLKLKQSPPDAGTHSTLSAPDKNLTPHPPSRSMYAQKLGERGLLGGKDERGDDAGEAEGRVFYLHKSLESSFVVHVGGIQ